MEGGECRGSEAEQKRYFIWEMCFGCCWLEWLIGPWVTSSPLCDVTVQGKQRQKTKQKEQRWQRCSHQYTMPYFVQLYDRLHQYQLQIAVICKEKVDTNKTILICKINNLSTQMILHDCSTTCFSYLAFNCSRSATYQVHHLVFSNPELSRSYYSLRYQQTRVEPICDLLLS